MNHYEPGFSVDWFLDLAVRSASTQFKTLNIGQNGGYGRVGFPVVWQLGPWIPGSARPWNSFLRVAVRVQY